MASGSQNNPLTYMDGVYVKIAENYKPPKRISMVMSYSQRLALNKLIQEPSITYDFSKEESIKSKIYEWKKARVAILEQRKQRLNQLNEDLSLKNNRSSQTNEVLDQKQNDTENLNEEGINSDIKVVKDPYYQKQGEILLPNVVKSNDNLLTPVPLNNSHLETCFNKNYVTKTQINYSEFETDTSSPFDNMELKILNDLEELAQVLKPESDENLCNSFGNQPKEITKPSKNSDNIYQKLVNNHYPSHQDNKNGYYTNFSIQNPLKTMQISSEHPSSDLSTNASYRSVKEIMKSLQDDLENTHIFTTPDDVKSNATASTELNVASCILKDDLDNPFNNLSNEIQNMALTISSMGFPLPRVARACELFEGNQKKIVEHLLAMTELLDLGFPEDKVAAALMKCENDRDKALDLLIT